jgi:hypothetical protein
MTQYKLKYRAVGKADYEFTFAWLAPDNCWRVYIEDQPLYRGRNTSDVSTHRLGLGSRPYVCWDRPLLTYEDARAVAALWADCTQQYIATGFLSPLRAAGPLATPRPVPASASSNSGPGLPQVRERLFARSRFPRQLRTGRLGRFADSWSVLDDTGTYRPQLYDPPPSPSRAVPRPSVGAEPALPLPAHDPG